MPEFIFDDSMPSSIDVSLNDGFKICDDALVSFWQNLEDGTWGGFTSAPLTCSFTQWDGQIRAFCPTSGRIVVHYTGDKLVVVDLF